MSLTVSYLTHINHTWLGTFYLSIATALHSLAKVKDYILNPNLDASLNSFEYAERENIKRTTILNMFPRANDLTVKGCTRTIVKYC